MKRVLALLGVFALLGTLFVIATSSPATAGDDCDEVAEVTDTTKPDDCKPDRPCKGAFGDKETAKLIWRNYGEAIDTEACCIDWELEGVAAWAEPYQCETPPCVDEFGEDWYRIHDNWWNWVDADTCCIDPTDGDTLPQGLRQYTCLDPEPTETPTEVPTEVPTEEVTPDPVPPTIIVPAPEVVIVPRPTERVVSTRPTFTG